MEQKEIDELILHSGCLVGRKEVAKALAESALMCVILADDADERYRDGIVTLCAANGTEILAFPSKAELGQLCKIQVSCAAVGIKR